jgi:RimJ/RimL family protein N-acetyltransferase
LEAWRREHRAHRTWDLQEPAEAWPLRVETERLILRPWEPEEATAFRGLALANQCHLLPWMPWAHQIGDVSEYLQRFRHWRAAIDARQDLVFGVFTKDGRPIGGTGMHPSVGPQAFEIGYWIDQSSVGRGLVTEWVAALVHLGLTVLGTDRLEIRCRPDNERSSGVARRLGFQHECTQRRRIPDGRGGLVDVMVWALYRDQLASSAAAKARYTAWDALGRKLPTGLE